jgi:hypothetical protein
LQANLPLGAGPHWQYDLIGVRVDYQICTMSDNDHLSFGFGRYEEKDEFVEY